MPQIKISNWLSKSFLLDELKFDLAILMAFMAAASGLFLRFEIGRTFIAPKRPCFLSQLFHTYFRMEGDAESLARGFDSEVPTTDSDNEMCSELAVSDAADCCVK